MVIYYQGELKTPPNFNGIGHTISARCHVCVCVWWGEKGWWNTNHFNVFPLLFRMISSDLPRFRQIKKTYFHALAEIEFFSIPWENTMQIDYIIRNVWTGHHIQRVYAAHMNKIDNIFRSHMYVSLARISISTMSFDDKMCGKYSSSFHSDFYWNREEKGWRWRRSLRSLPGAEKTCLNWKIRMRCSRKWVLCVPHERKLCKRWQIHRHDKQKHWKKR